jgi:hypothetical protein
MTLEEKIKKTLPTASVSVDEKAKIISANVAEVCATDLPRLMRFGLYKIGRSGSGITLKFNN